MANQSVVSLPIISSTLDCKKIMLFESSVGALRLGFFGERAKALE